MLAAPQTTKFKQKLDFVLIRLSKENRTSPQHRPETALQAGLPALEPLVLGTEGGCDYSMLRQFCDAFGSKEMKNITAKGKEAVYSRPMTG
jgi:hypothetical protein